MMQDKLRKQKDNTSEQHDDKNVNERLEWVVGKEVCDK